MRKSTESTYQRIQLHLIVIGEQQIRHDPFDDGIIELAIDIQRNTMLQPIGVSPRPDNTFQLRWGSRRLAAHHYLKRTDIEAKVVPPDEGTIRGTAARENLMRRQLTLQEEVACVVQMHDADKMSPNDIAAAVGKGREWVLKRLAIPQLPLDVRDSLLADRIPLAHAEVISRIDEEGTRAVIINHVIQNRWTLAQTREAIQGMEIHPAAAAAVAHVLAHPSPDIAHQQVMLECAACKTPRRPQDLTTIRVCSTGCADTPPAGAGLALAAGEPG